MDKLLNRQKNNQNNQNINFNKLCLNKATSISTASSPKSSSRLCEKCKNCCEKCGQSLVDQTVIIKDLSNNNNVDLSNNTISN